MANYKRDHRALTRSTDLKKNPYITTHYKIWTVIIFFSLSLSLLCVQFLACYFEETNTSNLETKQIILSLHIYSTPNNKNTILNKIEAPNIFPSLI